MSNSLGDLPCHASARQALRRIQAVGRIFSVLRFTQVVSSAGGARVVLMAAPLLETAFASRISPEAVGVIAACSLLFTAVHLVIGWMGFATLAAAQAHPTSFSSPESRYASVVAVCAIASVSCFLAITIFTRPLVDLLGVPDVLVDQAHDYLLVMSIYVLTLAPAKALPEIAIALGRPSLRLFSAIVYVVSFAAIGTLIAVWRQHEFTLSSLALSALAANVITVVFCILSLRREGGLVFAGLGQHVGVLFKTLTLGARSLLGPLAAVIAQTAITALFIRLDSKGAAVRGYLGSILFLIGATSWAVGDWCRLVSANLVRKRHLREIGVVLFYSQTMCVVGSVGIVCVLYGASHSAALADWLGPDLQGLMQDTLLVAIVGEAARSFNIVSVSGYVGLGVSPKTSLYEGAITCFVLCAIMIGAAMYRFTFVELTLLFYADQFARSVFNALFLPRILVTIAGGANAAMEIQKQQCGRSRSPIQVPDNGVRRVHEVSKGN